MLFDERIKYLENKILMLDAILSIATHSVENIKRARDKAVEEQIRLLQYQLDILQPLLDK